MKKMLIMVMMVMLTATTVFAERKRVTFRTGDYIVQATQNTLNKAESFFIYDNSSLKVIEFSPIPEYSDIPEELNDVLAEAINKLNQVKMSDYWDPATEEIIMTFFIRKGSETWNYVYDPMQYVWRQYK